MTTRLDLLERVAEAARKIASAADNLFDETDDRDEIWESPAAMAITAGDLRELKTRIAVFDAAPDDGPICNDCRRPYGDEYGFPDLVLPNDVWKKISPSGGDGGLLCPSCMCARATALGLKDVLAVFQSGPFAAPDDGWRPIETAPRDGTYILGNKRFIDAGWSPRVMYWDKGQWFSDPAGYVQKPELWRPLPPPPAPSSEAGK